MRHVVKAIKKGLHIYIYCDPKKNLNLMCSTIPNITDLLVTPPESILDDVD
jgi:hypothetical protein